VWRECSTAPFLSAVDLARLGFLFAWTLASLWTKKVGAEVLTFPSPFKFLFSSLPLPFHFPSLMGARRIFSRGEFIGVARIFSQGCTFFLKKVDELFVVASKHVVFDCNF